MLLVWGWSLTWTPWHHEGWQATTFHCPSFCMLAWGSWYLASCSACITSRFHQRRAHEGIVEPQRFIPKVCNKHETTSATHSIPFKKPETCKMPSTYSGGVSLSLLSLYLFLFTSVSIYTFAPSLSIYLSLFVRSLYPPLLSLCLSPILPRSFAQPPCPSCRPLYQLCCRQHVTWMSAFFVQLNKFVFSPLPFCRTSLHPCFASQLCWVHFLFEVAEQRCTL